MDVSMMGLWRSMGYFAKGVVIVLAIMSMYSLTIMVSKWWALRQAQKESRKFGKQFNPWALYKHVSGVNAVRLRRLLATPGELVEQITKLVETVQLHDDQIKTIVQVLRQMMEKPPEPSKSKIGFQAPA